MDQRRHDFETLCHIITQWNNNRLDLFALTLPNEELEFHGVIRFYFQYQDSSTGQKVATKCIRVASTATTLSLVETLIEKFRPDLKMLEMGEYALYEIHESFERRLNNEEKPLLVQLNWHKDDREGRFLLRRIDEVTQLPKRSDEPQGSEENGGNFKRKLSKREKKELKKQEKINKANKKENNEINNKDEEGVAHKLYNELPDSSFTRSISNPEAVMRRRRQQKLERKLQQFRSKDGGPDTGGTLKIYGEALCKEVPYKTLLLSVGDTAGFVVEEMLEKYGKDRREAGNFCLVEIVSDVERQVVLREIVLDDDECPLGILMDHTPSSGVVTFHVRGRPSDTLNGPRRRKKQSGGSAMTTTSDNQRLPFMFEVNSRDGSELIQGQRTLIGHNVTEVGSSIGSNGPSLLLSNAKGVKPRHCVLAHTDGLVTLTPCHRDAETFVNDQRIHETTILQHGCVVRFGAEKSFRFIDPSHLEHYKLNAQNSATANINVANEYSNRSASAVPNYMTNSSNMIGGGDNILPAVLEFREESEEAFFNSLTLSLDPNNAHFKLAPTYTLYMATRFRASTHYRPELIPEERAVRLTEMLNHVAELIYVTVQQRGGHDVLRLSFWMANASELLHFLKFDRHITSFSIRAQDTLAEVVHLAFKQLVIGLQRDLEHQMPLILIESDEESKEQEAMARINQILSSSMNLLRKCRVNAALTIQLFSQLFHFINMWTFNQLIHGQQQHKNLCTCLWGLRLKRRLSLIESWAERQGLELAAECHLARVIQASHLLLARKKSPEDIASVSSICYKLNSLQLKALLHQYQPDTNETPISSKMIDTIVRVAENTVDESLIAEGREIRVEEDQMLQLPFLLPEDGYSCDIIRGVPNGLVEFIGPLQEVGLCILTPQTTSNGFWTIYMDRFEPPATPIMPSPPLHPKGPPASHVTNHGVTNNSYNGGSPVPSSSATNSTMKPSITSVSSMSSVPQQQQQAVQLIRLAKGSGGMGLSIIGAKGVGHDKLGIYIKAVVEGGAAHRDGRLRAGDQLLTVDSHSLIGISQERAAEIMMKTGAVVELEVAVQGAIHHGLATLLSQPSPLLGRSVSNDHRPVDQRRLSERAQVSPQSHTNRPSIMSQPSKSTLSLQDHQPTYQNQSHLGHHVSGYPLLATAAQRQQHTKTNGYSIRSSSVQNLSPRGNANGGTLTRPISAHISTSVIQEEQQSYYQNVGSYDNGPMLHMRANNTAPMNTHTPSPVQSELESSLVHATPRVVTNTSIVGPEKPIRNFAQHSPNADTGNISSSPTRDFRNENSNTLNRGNQGPKTGRHSYNNGVNQHSGNRVRFQEPQKEEERQQHQFESGSLPRRERHSAPSAPSAQLEQLRLSHVEREFRRRVAEYNNKGDDIIEKKHGEIEAKRRQLQLATMAEQSLLKEAQNRQLKNEQSVSKRLDTLVSNNGGNGNKEKIENGIGSSNQSTPVKKVSFVNTEPVYNNGDTSGGTSSLNNDSNNTSGDSEDLEGQSGRVSREDPNAFLSEAETLLNANSEEVTTIPFDPNKSSGHTPSVIGAQEVYKDPRTRRLQAKAEEAQHRINTDGAALSFKEKRKLFAIEAGESTPVDKLKISRAQRDIQEGNNSGNSTKKIANEA